MTLQPSTPKSEVPDTSNKLTPHTLTVQLTDFEWGFLHEHFNGEAPMMSVDELAADLLRNRISKVQWEDKEQKRRNARSAGDRS